MIQNNCNIVPMRTTTKWISTEFLTMLSHRSCLVLWCSGSHTMWKFRELYLYWVVKVCTRLGSLRRQSASPLVQISRNRFECLFTVPGTRFHWKELIPEVIVCKCGPIQIKVFNTPTFDPYSGHKIQYFYLKKGVFELSRSCASQNLGHGNRNPYIKSLINHILRRQYSINLLN